MENKNKGIKFLIGILATGLLAIALFLGIYNLLHGKKGQNEIESLNSAYNNSVKNGFDGSMADWLSTIDDKFSYENAVDNGFYGTKEEWYTDLIDIINNYMKDEPDPLTYGITNVQVIDGNLVFTFSDGSRIDVGTFGKPGDAGAAGAPGPAGKDGAPGSSITDLTSVDIQETTPGSGEYQLVFNWDGVDGDGNPIPSQTTTNTFTISSSSIDVVDNLTTDDATKALSAKQGKVLNDTKLNNNFGTGNDGKVLKVNATGDVVLGDIVGGTDIIDDLNSTRTDAALSANQGKYLGDTLNIASYASNKGKYLYIDSTTGKVGFTEATNVTVDDSLSSSSTNPVQNKVINSALEGKVKNDWTTANSGKILTVGSDGKVTLTDPASSVDVINDLTTGGTNKALSAEQGKVLKGLVDGKVSTAQGAGNVGKILKVNSSGNLELADSPADITVDDSLSSTSTNPVQNKIINSALDGKVNIDQGTGTGNANVGKVLKVGADGKLTLATDDGTTYTAGTGISITGTTINHSNSITAETTGKGSATAVPIIKYDAQGHITGVDTTAMYPPTTAGTANQYWKSDGDGAGMWETPLSSLTGATDLNKLVDGNALKSVDDKFDNYILKPTTTDADDGKVLMYDKTNGFVLNSVSGDGTTVVDSLTSDSATDALSAKQGKVLKGLIDDIENDYVPWQAGAAKVGDVDSTDKGKILKVGADGKLALANEFSLTVDAALSDSSENPVQNKVINSALNNKLNIEDESRKTDTYKNKYLQINDQGTITYVDLPSTLPALTSANDYLTITSSGTPAALGASWNTPIGASNVGSSTTASTELITAGGVMKALEGYIPYTISTATDGQILKYDTTAGKFVLDDDGDTTYTGEKGITVDGATNKIGHSNTAITAETTGIGKVDTTTRITSVPTTIKYDAYGHITDTIGSTDIYAPTAKGNQYQYWMSNGSGATDGAPNWSTPVGNLYDISDTNKNLLANAQAIRNGDLVVLYPGDIFDAGDHKWIDELNNNNTVNKTIAKTALSTDLVPILSNIFRNKPVVQMYLAGEKINDENNRDYIYFHPYSQKGGENLDISTDATTHAKVIYRADVRDDTASSYDFIIEKKNTDYMFELKKNPPSIDNDTIYTGTAPISVDATTHNITHDTSSISSDITTGDSKEYGADFTYKTDSKLKVVNKVKVDKWGHIQAVPSTTEIYPIIDLGSTNQYLTPMKTTGGTPVDYLGWKDSIKDLSSLDDSDKDVLISAGAVKEGDIISLADYDASYTYFPKVAGESKDSPQTVNKEYNDVKDITALQDFLSKITNYKPIIEYQIFVDDKGGPGEYYYFYPSSQPDNIEDMELPNLSGSIYYRADTPDGYYILEIKEDNKNFFTKLYYEASDKLPKGPVNTYLKGDGESNNPTWQSGVEHLYSIDNDNTLTTAGAAREGDLIKLSTAISTDLNDKDKSYTYSYTSVSEDDFKKVFLNKPTIECKVLMGQKDKGKGDNVYSIVYFYPTEQTNNIDSASFTSTGEQTATYKSDLLKFSDEGTETKEFYYVLKYVFNKPADASATLKIVLSKEDANNFEGQDGIAVEGNIIKHAMNYGSGIVGDDDGTKSLKIQYDDFGHITHVDEFDAVEHLYSYTTNALVTADAAREGDVLVVPSDYVPDAIVISTDTSSKKDLAYNSQDTDGKAAIETFFNGVYKNKPTLEMTVNVKKNAIDSDNSIILHFQPIEQDTTVSTTISWSDASSHYVKYKASITNVKNTDDEYMKGDYIFTITKTELNVLSCKLEFFKTYSATDGITIDGNNVIKHTNSITSGTKGGIPSGKSGIVEVPVVTYDDQGHITSSIDTDTIYAPTDAGTQYQYWMSNNTSTTSTPNANPSWNTPVSNLFDISNTNKKFLADTEAIRKGDVYVINKTADNTKMPYLNIVDDESTRIVTNSCITTGIDYTTNELLREVYYNKPTIEAYVVTKCEVTAGTPPTIGDATEGKILYFKPLSQDASVEDVNFGYLLNVGGTTYVCVDGDETYTLNIVLYTSDSIKTTLTYSKPDILDSFVDYDETKDGDKLALSKAIRNADIYEVPSGSFLSNSIAVEDPTKWEDTYTYQESYSGSDSHIRTFTAYPALVDFYDNVAGNKPEIQVSINTHSDTTAPKSNLIFTPSSYEGEYTDINTSGNCTVTYSSPYNEGGYTGQLELIISKTTTGTGTSLSSTITVTLKYVPDIDDIYTIDRSELGDDSKNENYSQLFAYQLTYTSYDPDDNQLKVNQTIDKYHAMLFTNHNNKLVKFDDNLYTPVYKGDDYNAYISLVATEDSTSFTYNAYGKTLQWNVLLVTYDESTQAMSFELYDGSKFNYNNIKDNLDYDFNPAKAISYSLYGLFDSIPKNKEVMSTRYQPFVLMMPLLEHSKEGGNLQWTASETTIPVLIDTDTVIDYAEIDDDGDSIKVFSDDTGPGNYKLENDVDDVKSVIWRDDISSFIIDTKIKYLKTSAGGMSETNFEKEVELVFHNYFSANEGIDIDNEVGTPSINIEGDRRYYCFFKLDEDYPTIILKYVQGENEIVNVTNEFIFDILKGLDNYSATTEQFLGHNTSDSSKLQWINKN